MTLATSDTQGERGGGWVVGARIIATTAKEGHIKMKMKIKEKDRLMAHCSSPPPPPPPPLFF